LNYQKNKLLKEALIFFLLDFKVANFQTAERQIGSKKEIIGVPKTEMKNLNLLSF
jgi:hypothetical protein